jgi:hypothetical protein
MALHQGPLGADDLRERGSEDLATAALVRAHSRLIADPNFCHFLVLTRC